ncbi:MAG TPA: helicase-related protein, partial [bacterium]|nr:helicase-related protein [bacterium]
VYTSATPSAWEIEASKDRIVEQIIRPTGLIDPRITVLNTEGQIEDLFSRILEKTSLGERVLVTTLTKRMAEELATYLVDKGIKVTYLHSDIETLERSNILDDLRKGNYDVLVGINLLREGLDLPEVSLVAILDADKEGFLRSESALIQTMGRAARHINGEVVMYADNVTKSMERAIGEVNRRRAIQEKYNIEHNITPVSISKPIRAKLYEEVIDVTESDRKKTLSDIDYLQLPPKFLKKELLKLTKEMQYEADSLNFEKAAVIRDQIRKIKKQANLT